MLNTLPRLSIWEIACRMNDLDPRKVETKNLPLNVRDALKSLTRAIHYDEDLPVLSNRGIENQTVRNEKTGLKYDNETVHNKISDCYEKELFDKDFLDTIYFENEHFAKWCFRKIIPLPIFWFPNGWDFEESENIPTNIKSEANLRPNQIDKLLCQAISRTLWSLFPEMTIASMCKHEAIQIFGNGKQYKGAHTLRDWISEVAPENIKGNKGRPKNANPNNQAV